MLPRVCFGHPPWASRSALSEFVGGARQLPNRESALASSPPHPARRRKGRTFRRMCPVSCRGPASGGGGKCVVDFLFQLRACVGNLAEELFVFGQEVVHVAGAGVEIVRILEVEVKVAGLNLVDGDAPSLLVFHPRLKAVFF